MFNTLTQHRWPFNSAVQGDKRCRYAAERHRAKTLATSSVTSKVNPGRQYQAAATRVLTSGQSSFDSVKPGMAFYAGVVGAVGAAGTSVTDSRSGWGRQLALTPLRPAQLAFANAVSIAVRAVLPIAAVFIAGALTNAKMQPEQWALTFLACVLCSIPFGFYGLAWTLAIPKENTVGIATGSIVILAFAANMFMPLTGALLDIGRFTPMYGAMMLVRWPLAEGGQVAGMGFTYEPMWHAWVSISVWTAIFVGFCLMMRKRDKNRS